MSNKWFKPLSRLTAGFLALPLLLIACGQDSPIAPPDQDGAVLVPAGLTVPAGAISIRPTDVIQNIVNAHPAGTFFLIKAGVYDRQTVEPKNGMTFLGEAGAILDGEGATAYAFKGDADNVTIMNLEIRNYKPASYMAAVRGDKSTGWVIEDCEVHHNVTGGIRIGDGMVIRGNDIHHNARNGINGAADDVLIVDNVVAFNGSPQYASNSTGGVKVVNTRDLVVRNNDVHDNMENGIWQDVSAINSLIEGNRIVDNAGQGIMFEISYGAVIRNNYVEGNGFRRPRWLYGAGIMVSSSPDVEIYGNTVKNNAQGITAVQQDRGSGTLGLHETRNLYVHDNVVTMDEGLTGLAQSVGNNAYFTSKNNRFRDNTYYLGPNAKYFTWMNAKRSVKEWKAYGQDVGGEFH